MVQSRYANIDEASIVEVVNEPAESAPYFTPKQHPPAGTPLAPASDDASLPKLFAPLRLRSINIRNRVLLSPLCQYSAEDGHQTDWHFAHLGGIISRGPGLSFVEATSVVPEGRITPEDCGLWKESQIAPLRRIVDFAHSQGQMIGIQLAHAGRKASTVAPWLSMARGPAAAPKTVNGYENEGFAPAGGWPDNVVAPSAVAYKDKNVIPHEMSRDEIHSLVEEWGEATKRAVQCGFDAIEIHGAHGYLIHEFLSPVTNRRTDEYGGSFENRTRLALEIVEITRKIIPEGMPLFFRVSGTEWLEHMHPEPSWDIQETIKLAQILSSQGVDVLDISSGGNDPRQKITGGPAYQAPFAHQVKKAVGDKLLVATVGAITSGKQANEILEAGLDMVLVGRYFQKDPNLVWTFAEELDIHLKLANQIQWGFGGHRRK
ncbi:NADH:flavin oxidoreductase/NADH oxidase [Aspergillus melleus]|uniref:NADH:flavin oxidoreductase/NADH oxidase n=1 Tax=Aspergillus melleus TaxID=138277 RepID=UPI001E8E6231|nr:NADH-dependent flavin oxidoreductase [Aspergillus melleus]KAH8424483.1 NADH-dependent flavin oxidoreductase [Aspergillus melleus]